MYLVRLEEDVRFYQILIGPELFEFAMVVPNDLRLPMPLEANEFLPVITKMRQRSDLPARHKKRLLNISPDDLRPFRRPFLPQELDLPVRAVSSRLFSACSSAAAPPFQYSSISSFLACGAAVEKPAETEQLDFEAAVGAVIGVEGRDIPIEEADSYIAGFVLLNDWTARDIERQEREQGYGAAKSKDFAISIGRGMLTPDELEPYALPEDRPGKRYQMGLTIKINGETAARANLDEMRWSFAELISHASRRCPLQPGDLIVAEGLTGGSLQSLKAESRLNPGDIVRIELEDLEWLENRVTPSRTLLPVRNT